MSVFLGVVFALGCSCGGLYANCNARSLLLSAAPLGLLGSLGPTDARLCPKHVTLPKATVSTQDTVFDSHLCAQLLHSMS